MTARLGFGFWSFILFMLVLTGLFAWLGMWQVHRLAEKEALIAEVDRQLTQPPYDIPPSDQWSLIDLDTYAYHPLTLVGHYVNEAAVLVFTNLPEPKGKFGGPGYWLMTPFDHPALPAVLAYVERLSERPAFLKHGRNGLP